MRLTFCKSMKTHVEKMSAFSLSIMLMKTSELNRSLHYVDEKKGNCSPGSTGRKQRMKDPYDKGVANHSAPSFARYAARRAVKRKQGNSSDFSPRLDAAGRVGL